MVGHHTPHHPSPYPTSSMFQGKTISHHSYHLTSIFFIFQGKTIPHHSYHLTSTFSMFQGKTIPHHSYHLTSIFFMIYNVQMLMLKKSSLISCIEEPWVVMLIYWCSSHRGKRKNERKIKGELKVKKIVYPKTGVMWKLPL